MVNSERKKRKRPKPQRSFTQDVDKDKPNQHPTLTVDDALHRSPPTKQEQGTKKTISRFKNDFLNLGSIGKGGFGIVYKVKHHLDDENYAVKRIRIRAKHKKKFIGEVKHLTKLIHKNVVRYYNSWIECSPDINYETPDEHSEVEQDNSDTVGSSIVFVKNVGGDAETTHKPPQYNLPGTTHDEVPSGECTFLFIQMEYCGNDTLRTYINEGLCQQPKRRLRIFRNMLHGIEYIHSKGIIHRDLKPENILIDRDKKEKVKIGDFGLATVINLKKAKTSGKNMDSEKLTTNIGSLMYVSPEMMSEESMSSYGNEVDIYSLGVIFFEMSYKPFTTDMERAVILGRVRSKEIGFPDDFDEHKMAIEIRLIRCMLNHDPKQRPSAKCLKQLLQKSSSTSHRHLGRIDLACALINSILNPLCSHEPEPMLITDIEDALVKHCQGVTNTAILSFKDAYGLSLVEFIKKKQDLYEMYEDKNGEMVKLKVCKHPANPSTLCPYTKK